jgi:hypothetical protein
MKKLTKKQRQWTWFGFLWIVSLAVVLSLAYMIRWVMGMA